MKPDSRSRWPLCALLAAMACSPQPSALRAGVATVPLDAPIGVPMGGYSRHKSPADRGSKWAQNFPASTGMLTQPTARALALDDGLQQVVIVRTDTALPTATLQRRAEQHLGGTAHLIVTSTHTHAGPARYFRSVVSTGGSGLDVTAVAMDKYDLEIEDRLAVSIAEAAKQALAQLTPVAVGHGEAEAPMLNSDRRCQNDALYGPDYRDRTLKVVRFDAVDATGTPTRPLAALLEYAAHGTVLGDGNTLFSGDAPGALEHAATDLLGVPVLYLQGSAGDVSPHTDSHAATQALEAYGVIGAPIVAQAFTAAAPHAASKRGTLQLTKRAVATTREACGYAPGEFPEFGAIGCGLGDQACDQQLEPKTIICLPLSKTGVTQSPVAALKVEDVLLVLLPGEPSTAIGAKVHDAAAALEGVNEAIVVGYAFDHSGYLLEEADYLRGGYEPTVSPWGWKFGDHVVAEVKTLLGSLGKEQTAYVDPDLPAVTDRRPVADSATMPAVLEQPKALERLATATFRWAGGDPGLDAPQVTLERQRDGAFEAVTDAGPLVLRERATPSYAEDAGATVRTHEYTVQFETVPTTPLSRYRFTVKGTAQLSGSPTAYRLESDAFELSASTAAGTLGEAALLSDGRLAVKLRFPPNPVLFGDPSTDPIGNYRLRDLGSTAEQGALARGGQAAGRATVNGVPQSISFTWSDDANALVAPASAGPATAVDFDALAFSDGAGNRNGQAVHLSVDH